LGITEYYDTSFSGWIATSVSGVVATGGNSVYDMNHNGTAYRVHVFTDTGTSTFNVTKGGEVEYLIVAGGGGGSSSEGDGNGGGSGIVIIRYRTS